MPAADDLPSMESRKSLFSPFDDDGRAEGFKPMRE